MIQEACGCIWDGPHRVKACGKNPRTRPPLPNPLGAVKVPVNFSEDWKRLTPSDCLQFLATHPEVTTRRLGAVQCLTWLHQEFGR